MEARQRTIDDVYKRKLQRIKVSNGEKPFHIASHEKSPRSKVYQMKLLVFCLILVTFFLLFSSSPFCSRGSISHSVSQPYVVNRWIWGESDPRYASQLVINWDEITEVVVQQSKKTKIQEVGLLNFKESENKRWRMVIPGINYTTLHLDYADKNITWDTLYPEWIDEEQDDEVPSCPSLPKLEVPRRRLDLIAVKLPCRNEGNWSRDVARLHLQLAAAGLAASVKGSFPVHLLLVTNCFPIPNLFHCKELVRRQGNTWLYTPDLNVLREKLQLPVGSCELALPLQVKEKDYSKEKRREAYATILHSANFYACGAIVAARSIRQAGSTRDLVILVDETISEYHRSGLEYAGWQVRTIKRIRNPKAEKDAYNEWNYSKFRLWQLTDYDKIIFIDADMLILRNIDFLFKMPEISATGNNGTLFNSGVMVIEPCNCTFQLLMDHINEIESYNGGDQGYLNEIFTWWHRIPKHMNFLKHFWTGDEDAVKQKKTRLFAAEPPVLYVIHYLGNKPWMCFREYDCNWNVDIQREFASDAAHSRWWKVHDTLPETLQNFCLLPSLQKSQLEYDRREAQKARFSDEHWKIKIKDGRINKCIDKLCNWKSMVKHWGENNWTDDPSFYPTPPALNKASLSGL